MAKKSELAGLLRVYCIKPDSRKFNRSLDITDKRAAELATLSGEIFKKEKILSMAMEKISVICKNANELAYVSFHKGHDYGILKVETVIKQLLTHPLLKDVLLKELAAVGVNISEIDKSSEQDQTPESPESPGIY